MTDFSTAVRGWLTGRHLVYLVIATVLVSAGMFAVGRSPGQTPQPDPRASALPADLSQTASEPVAAAPQPSDTAAAGADRSGPAFAAAPFDFAPITDGVPRMKKPDVVRGLYLNVWAAASTKKLARLIDVANRTEINAFVIDVKEAGEIGYRSQVPLAGRIGSDKGYIGDVRGMLRKLKENNIYPIARIVVFRDPILAQARPDWAVQHRDSGEWVDRDGHRWVDSYNRDVWDYNIAIAREALELGFAEVQWDYVRFPDVPQSYMRTAVWPAQNGRSKEDGIREFLLYSREQLAKYDAPITADVFGLTTSAGDDMGIGQLWSKMVDATDVLLPMVYPSHYARGSYGIAHPNAQPAAIVRTAMQHAVRRTKDVPNAATIRPWLQDFTLGAPRYGPAHVRAQINAVYEAGVSEWVLWHPGSNYSVEALATADGKVPVFAASELKGAPDTVAPKPAAVPAGTRPLGVPVDTIRR